MDFTIKSNMKNAVNRAWFREEHGRKERKLVKACQIYTQKNPSCYKGKRRNYSLLI